MCQGRALDSTGPAADRSADVLAARAYVLLLQDLYGGLLTERQRQLLHQYYEEDLSLGEIAAQLGTSRQAVHDRLGRAVHALQQYERCLGLAARWRRQRRQVAEVLALLGRIRTADGPARLGLLEQAERLAAELLGE